MDAPVTTQAQPSPRPDGSVQREASPLDELVQIGAFASDALKLAAHEARLALAGAASALALVIGALVGALVVASLLIVATIFALHAAGLSWALSFLVTALGLGLLCYLAVRRAGSLVRRLTLPVTRDALQPRDQQ